MSVIALILGIEKVIGLVQMGLASAKAIRQAVEDGKLAVRDANDNLLTADDVQTHIDAAVAKAGDVGDAAAGRIEDRER